MIVSSYIAFLAIRFGEGTVEMVAVEIEEVWRTTIENDGSILCDNLYTHIFGGIILLKI